MGSKTAMFHCNVGKLSIMIPQNYFENLASTKAILTRIFTHMRPCIMIASGYSANCSQECQHDPASHRDAVRVPYHALQGVLGDVFWDFQPVRVNTLQLEELVGGEAPVA